jgi:hypothetical protein
LHFTHLLVAEIALLHPGSPQNRCTPASNASTSSTCCSDRGFFISPITFQASKPNAQFLIYISTKICYHCVDFSAVKA